MKVLTKKIMLVLCAVTFLFGVHVSQAVAGDIIKWKMPTAYPAGSYLWEFIAANFAEKVKTLSNGRLLITPITSGAICPALKIPDAVREGVAEAGHTWTGYDMGRDMTAVLFAGIPGGLSDEQYLGWYYEGNGMKFLKEFRKAKMGVFSTVLGIGPTEIVHSHKPIHTLADYKGLKMRTAGVWAELLPEFGAVAVTLPASDVFQALEKKLVDAIEWADPGSNFPLGYHQVAKYVIVPGVHLPAWPWELIVNAQKWAQLPDDLKMIVEFTAKSITFDSWLKFINNSQQAMAKFQKSGNEIIVLDTGVLEAVHKAAAKYCEAEAAKNALFKKVYDDQKAFKKAWDEANYIRMRPDGYGK